MVKYKCEILRKIEKALGDRPKIVSELMKDTGSSRETLNKYLKHMKENKRVKTVKRVEEKAYKLRKSYYIERLEKHMLREKIEYSDIENYKDTILNKIKKLNKEKIRLRKSIKEHKQSNLRRISYLRKRQEEIISFRTLKLTESEIAQMREKYS